MYFFKNKRILPDEEKYVQVLQKQFGLTFSH